MTLIPINELYEVIKVKNNSFYIGRYKGKNF